MNKIGRVQIILQDWDKFLN